MTAEARSTTSQRVITAIGVIASNLVPVFGVAFLGWDATPILVLYWMENLVLGALGFARIMASRGAIINEAPAEGRSNLGTGCFFAFTYGFFWVGHGIFALIVANRIVDKLGPNAPGVWGRTFGDAEFWISVAGMAVIAIALEIRNWWSAGQWRTASPSIEMMRPFGRVAVLQLAMLAGFYLLDRFDAPAWTILALCLLKLLLELAVALLSRTTGWRVME